MIGDQAENIEKMMDDPKMLNQMTGFWKQLDEMASSDQKGYEEFIKKQKEEFESEQKRINEEKEKKRIIQSSQICCIKVLCSKIIVQNKDKNLSDTIKLFDFEKDQEFKKSFLENEDSAKPLEQPKLYLNILFHEKVIGPLNQDRDYADPKNDAEWKVIPISFSPPKERWSGSGMKCIIIDGHVNTCVMEMFKQGPKKIGALTNYIIERFQNLLKDHYIFNKKSIKILKTKKYKAWRGKNDEVPEYVLPEAYHVDYFAKVIQKAKEVKEKM
jgi:hypothetical protein